MAKEKITVTLDAAALAELRSVVGSRSISATLDEALAAHLQRLRHFAAVDQWLAEMEAEDGPIPPDVTEWATREIDAWMKEKVAYDQRQGSPGRVAG